MVCLDFNGLCLLLHRPRHVDGTEIIPFGVRRPVIRRAPLLDQSRHHHVRGRADERPDPSPQRPEHRLPDERVTVQRRMFQPAKVRLERLEERDLHGAC